MSKPGISSLPNASVIYTYLKRYQEDPGSRVFAPLAEAYRKAGLLDEAIEIAREGLRVHPGFVSGRVALARALFDKKLYSEVCDELRPVAQENPDNLVAQRLMAESSLMLGRVADALTAYKMLLYFSPGEAETARMVSELEAEAYERGALVLQKENASPNAVSAESAATEFSVKPAFQALTESPEAREQLKREKHVRWMKQVELLQSLLTRVELAKARRA